MFMIMSDRPWIVTLLMGGILLLNGCTEQTPQQAAAVLREAKAAPAKKLSGRGTGDTLRLLYWQAPTTLNPHLTQSEKDWEAGRLTYEPLASYDQDGNLVPFLAAEIPTLENGDLAPDGKSVTWKLKQGVKWSDGEPFTASDVRFTYEFITNPKVGSASTDVYATVHDVEVIDNQTVKILFKDMNPAWSQPFVGIQGVILPRHIFEPYNGSNANEAPANKIPVGTGPYRVVPPGIKPQEVLFLGNELVETNKILFEPNPFFREKDKLSFSRVEVKGGGTVTEAARLVLQTGDVDYAWNLQMNTEALTQLQSGGKGKGLPKLGSGAERVLLNRTDPNRQTEEGERSSMKIPHPFFSDKKVRQAFAYAIDRKAIAKLYPAGSLPADNILVSPTKYQSPNTSGDFNTDLARELLDDAGWTDSNGDGIRDKDGVKMKVVFQTTVNQVRQQAQQIIKQALESLGIDVELKLTDASIFFSKDPSNPNTRGHFTADMQEFYTGSDSPDPGAFMSRWTCNAIPQKAGNWSGTNVERWCSPEYDALYQQSTTELDPEKRRQLFIQMNDLLIHDVVTIPLVQDAMIFGVSDSIEGISLTPWDAGTWNIKDWRRVAP